MRPEQLAARAADVSLGGPSAPDDLSVEEVTEIFRPVPNRADLRRRGVGVRRGKPRPGPRRGGSSSVPPSIATHISVKVPGQKAIRMTLAEYDALVEKIGVPQ